MGDEGFGRRIPFAFLQAIMKDFDTYSGRASSAIAYSMNRDFAPVLKRQMEYYAKGGAGGDKLAKIKGEVEQVKGIMVENIERVLERGEQIDLLVDKSENLDVNARLFKTRHGDQLFCWFRSFFDCGGVDGGVCTNGGGTHPCCRLKPACVWSNRMPLGRPSILPLPVVPHPSNLTTFIALCMASPPHHVKINQAQIANVVGESKMVDVHCRDSGGNHCDHHHCRREEEEQRLELKPSPFT
jgi:hypothetical protein